MTDRQWMQRALRLAANGFTPPNPMVGCILVREGKVVGQGFHSHAGQPHAEAVALSAAGDAARGATAYVNLEPCSHWGRTPPCADALIRAGVARVVAAAEDPNPKVSGEGLKRLRAAGIEVESGVLHDQALLLNEAFFHFHTFGTPFVTLKAASTLDGKIATRSGDSRWVTGPEARRFSHRLRAQSGAILVGVGTVVADDPLLTARLDPPAPRQPLRIIVDSQLRTPPDAKAVRATMEGVATVPLLIATTERADKNRESALQLGGVEIVRLPCGDDGRVDLRSLMTLLAERQIISVLVDGGGELHAALIAAQAPHKIAFFVAPKIVGGKTAPTSVEGEGAARMADAVQIGNVSVRKFGTDLLIQGYFPPRKLG